MITASKTCRNRRYKRGSGETWLLALGVALALAAAACAPTVPDVVTQRNDNMRTGANLAPGLNQRSVKSFRLLQALPVHDPVLAQPLFLHAMRYRGAFHSMIWVATVTNKLYPFDANPSFDQLGSEIDLGPPFTPSQDYLDKCLPREAIMGQPDGRRLIGIESTPVIDRTRNRMYVSYRVNGGTGGVQRLAAIELSTGSILRSVVVPGSDVWHTIHRNRMSLLLDGGIVYVGYSAVNEGPRICDYGKAFQGWIHAFDANTLVHLGAWRSVRDSHNTSGDATQDTFDGGGLWQASTGIAADGQGSIFFSTGNGSRNPQPPDPQGLNLSNAIVRIHPNRVAAAPAPNAGGNPASMVTEHQQHIFYRAADGSIQHIFWDDHEAPGQLHHDNWSQKAGNPPPAAGDPATMVYGNQQHVFYRATDNTIRHLYWGPDAPANTVWTDNWSQKAGNPPPAAGDPATMVYGNQQHVFYRATDNTIRHLYWGPDAPANTVWTDNWTQKAGNPPAAVGDPATMVYGNQQHVFYRATDNTIRHLYWGPDAPANTVWTDNWMRKAGNPPAAVGDPATMVYGNQQHVFYRATDNTIRHLYWGPDAPANTVWTDNWTRKAGNPPAAVGDPATMVYGNQQHVFYRATDNTIRHLYWGPDAPANTVWTDNWTRKAGNPPAAVGDPATMVYGNQQHVFYRATDNTIRHLFWAPDARANTVWTDNWNHLPDLLEMHAADWFVPYRKLWHDRTDLDLGAGGVMLMPGTPYLVQAGKEGILYVLDRNKLGKFDDNPPFDPKTVEMKTTADPGGPDDFNRDHVVQKLRAGINHYCENFHINLFCYRDTPYLKPKINPNGPRSGITLEDWIAWPHVHGTPVFGTFAGGRAFLYIWPEKDHLKSYAWTGNRFDRGSTVAGRLPDNTLAVLAPPYLEDHIGAVGMPGGMLSLAIDPTQSAGGVLFASVQRCRANEKDDSRQECSFALCSDPERCKDQRFGSLRAFDPMNMKELWNNLSGPRDAQDYNYFFAKYVPPTIANGRVFLATGSNVVLVYGAQ